MAQTKSEKIESIKKEIEQLENRKKMLLKQQSEQERKERTHRFCKRMGIFESLIPEAVKLTDEQFKTYLEKTLLTDYARKIFKGLLEQSGETATEKTATTESVDTATSPQIKGNGAGNEG